MVKRNRNSGRSTWLAYAAVTGASAALALATVSGCASTSQSAGQPDRAAAADSSAAPDPSSPQQVKAAGNSGGLVDVSWQAPVNAGKSPVTSYVLQYSAAGGPMTQIPGGSCADPVPGAVFECYVFNLPSAASYTFSVAAKSAAGMSPAVTSNAVAQLPTAPFNLNATITSAGMPGQPSQADFVWMPPTTPGPGGVTSYEVSYSERGGNPTAVPQSSCTGPAPAHYVRCTASLPAGGAYFFSVAAVNATGKGPAATSNTLANPLEPVLGAVSVSDSAATTAVVHAQIATRGGLTKVYISYGEVGGKRINQATKSQLTEAGTSNFSYTMKNLKPGSKNSVTVSAENSAGRTKSKSVSFNTL